MTCDHKFIGSNHCLKCGWEAPGYAANPTKPAAPTAEPVDLDWFESAATGIIAETDEAASWTGDTESATPVADALPLIITELRHHRANAAEAEARGARMVLSELSQLVKTKKWLDQAGGKEAAWGRAYNEAARALERKYAQKGQDGIG